MSKLLKFKQGNQIYYVTSLKFEEIEKCSKVSIYGEDEYGYQRNPNYAHYSKISSIFKSNILPIFPTAILLAGDTKDIEQMFDKLEYDFSNSKYIFRIVDGQHRIEGIKKAIVDYPDKSEDIRNMEFCVIIMSINDGDRLKEVKTFCDVNIKAKPIKKDLAYLAQYKIRRLENTPLVNRKSDDCFEIGISICKKLNEYDTNRLPIWHNAFIYDTVQANKGIVGMKSFVESVEKLYNYKWHPNMTTKEIDDDIPNEIIDNLMIPVWEYLYNRFNRCFTVPCNINDEGEDIYYNFDYNIQKTLGVKVVHKLLSICFESSNKDYKLAVSTFIEKMEHSDIDFESWRVGGRFAGVSSEAGYAYIAKKLYNEENF